MLAAVIGLTLLGLAAIAMIWRAHLGDDSYVKTTAKPGFGLLGLFSVGVLLSTVAANILASQRPRR